jgi:hypothetical protein
MGSSGSSPTAREKPVKGNPLATALAGKIAPSVPLKASMEVCTSMTRSRLARVLLNTHVMTILNVMVGERTEPDFL